MNIYHYTFSKPKEYTTTRMNPNKNCGLWMIMMCQCRVIFGKKKKKKVILVSDVGRSCACVGAGSIWEISLPSP